MKIEKILIGVAGEHLVLSRLLARYGVCGYCLDSSF